MSVFARITRIFGIPGASTPSERPARTGRSAIGELRPREAVRVMPRGGAGLRGADERHGEGESRPSARVVEEAGEDARAEHEIESATLPGAPRNKQELLAELRRNYAEAVNLIRKIDGHLDDQARRSQRVVELAERLPEAIEHLSALRHGQSEIGEGIRAMRDALREGQIRQDAGMERQRDILERQAGTMGRIEMLFEESANVDRELGHALGEFRGAVLQMNAGNHRLGGALEQLDRREREHEERLHRLAERGRNVTNALIILCGLGVATALVSVMGVLYLVTR